MSDKPSKGYRNPPVHSRFKKGQSGNPGGRKKGSRNFKSVLEELMALEVEQPGEKRPITLMEALFLKQADCGLKGDWRATDSLADRCERYGLHREDAKAEISEEDEQMLDEFFERRQRPLEAEQTEQEAEQEAKPDQEPKSEFEPAPEPDLESETND